MLRGVAVESRDIPIGLIREPALPSRASMDEHKLEALTASVQRHGVLLPLIVFLVGEFYEVAAGHRRYLAAKRAGLVVVPCRVYASEAAAMEAAKYIENALREDLNPAEEAVYFSELLARDCGDDVDKLCEQLDVKRSHVESRLLLMQGDELVFAALQDNAIGVGVATELNKCTNERRRRSLLLSAINGGATQSVVRGWVQDWQREEQYANGAPAPAAPAAAPSAVPETNYFTCCVCQGTDNVHLMIPINVHRDCYTAILEKMLAAYRGER